MFHRSMLVVAHDAQQYCNQIIVSMNDPFRVVLTFHCVY